MCSAGGWCHMLICTLLTCSRVLVNEVVSEPIGIFEEILAEKS